MRKDTRKGSTSIPFANLVYIVPVFCRECTNWKGGACKFSRVPTYCRILGRVGVILEPKRVGCSWYKSEKDYLGSAQSEDDLMRWGGKEQSTEDGK